MAKKRITKKRMTRLLGSKSRLEGIVPPDEYCPVCGRKKKKCICNNFKKMVQLIKEDCFSQDELEELKKNIDNKSINVNYITPSPDRCPVCGCSPCRCK